jgi:hypothetical protein
LDIGASGPLAGFVAAVPITIFGLVLSANAPVLSLANCGPTILGMNYGNLLIGLPPIWAILSLFVPVGAAQNLHPLAFAGWVGLLVTAINLIPAGQLDGGHVARALLGDRARYASWGALLVLFALGFFYPGWFIFAILIFLLGMRHPAPLNDITPLDPKRIAVGAVALILLVGGFAVVPISTPSGQYSVSQSAAPVNPLPAGYAMGDTVALTVVNRDSVDHGFLFNASISGVIGTMNGKPTPLTGAARQAFVANATWVVTLPNGNRSVYTGVDTWAVPSPDYSKVPAAGGQATVSIQFFDRQSAVVALTVAASQVCASGGGHQSLQVTIH